MIQVLDHGFKFQRIVVKILAKSSKLSENILIPKNLSSYVHKGFMIDFPKGYFKHFC